MVLPPVVLVDTPLPAAPILAAATNLQQPQPAPLDPTPPDQPDAAPRAGVHRAWRPAPAFGVTAWPTGADEAPPLDATIFQVERRLEPAGPWEPVLEDENWTLGDRDGAVRDPALPPGSELLAAYPDVAGHPSGATLDLSLVDTFDEDATTVQPTPGTRHRYRVRAIDAIGRPSPDWRETDAIRLEKHVPPPVPVGPDDMDAAGPNEPVGVQARVLVRDAPDLAPAEEALLGAHDTAVVLRWGWHDDQREQDPLATEFRVYVAPPLDVVEGAVTGVTTLTTGLATSYRVDLQLDREIRADLAAGLRLDAGHPFLIRSHTAGATIQLVVETRLATAAGTAPVPTLGPVRLSLPLTPDRTRPPAWSERIQVLPITAETSYQVVLPDLLVVDEDHRTDQQWVGVSAADDQSYVRRPAGPCRHPPRQRERGRPGVGHGPLPRPAHAGDPATAGCGPGRPDTRAGGRAAALPPRPDSAPARRGPRDGSGAARTRVGTAAGRGVRRDRRRTSPGPSRRAAGRR